MFYNRAIKVSSSHNQSYTEIGSVYHGAYLSHILIIPPLRAYSGRGSVLFSFLVYFFYKTLFSIFPFFCGHTMACPYMGCYLYLSFFCFRLFVGTWRAVFVILLLGCRKFDIYSCNSQPSTPERDRTCIGYGRYIFRG